MRQKLTERLLKGYEGALRQEEKSEATIEKYLFALRRFQQTYRNRIITKEKVMEYKSDMAHCYAASSVNCALAALNSFFNWAGWYECKVKPLHIQKQTFAAVECELTKEEYFRLLQAACDTQNTRIYYLLETVCATGIRISELPYITVEAVRAGRACVNCKGKIRVIILPTNLCCQLKNYLAFCGPASGSIFVSCNGNPLNRSNIWSEMKKLCDPAGVSPAKVYPHNLRHLFARTYYAATKDLDELATVLGHSSINTTRIYTRTTDTNHVRQINRLDLLA